MLLPPERESPGYSHGRGGQWTLEQFLRLPEVKPALEFDHGRVDQKVSPTTEHALLQAHLCRCTGYQSIVNAVHRAAETS